MSKKQIGIIGATGFTGSELVRILYNHPDIEIKIITSESRKGDKFSDVHPFFKNIFEMELKSVDEIHNYNLDLVFLALPHGVSMNYVKKFANSDFKIIDLSGDFRLKNPETYEEWYKKAHSFAEGFENAVYGIPELFSDEIKTANLIANPGCYPTSAILGISPLADSGLISSKVIIDSKSGVTGAGVKAKEVNRFSNVNDNFKAYGLKKHRHSIEIESIISEVAGKESQIQFTPHLLPIDRGILSTIYIEPNKKISKEEVQKLYTDFYSDSKFVRLRNNPPEVKDVRGTNYCDVYVDFDERTNTIIIISAIDNLVKGAAGQAVQNMNIMLGYEEHTALDIVPLNP